MDILTSLTRTAITILIFVAMLGVLVVIHELGHFIVARLAGVRVLEFGIGFPPQARVLRSKGETLITLNWLPFGGFVRLEGEEGDSEDPRSFVRASLPIKLLILLAGVAMNALLAVAIFSAIAWAPGPTAGLGFTAVVPGSPAAGIGLVGIGAGPQDTPSDIIVAVDGQRFHDFDFDGAGRLIDALRTRAGQAVTLTIVHPGDTVTDVTVTLRSPAEVAAGSGALGIKGPFFERSVDQLFTRSPGSALDFGLAQTGQAFGLITDGLAQLGGSIVNHPTQDPGVAGPVGIAVGIGDVFWSRGAIATLQLAALLSANLALVNILPVPPLDGGRILVLVTKALAGRRLSLRVERATYTIGAAFLLAFILWVTFFDLTRQAGTGQ
jgi:regulator of sigma E protease